MVVKKENFFLRYKPRNVTVPMYESWLVDFFYETGNFDPSIFNSWWYERAKSEALEKILQEPDQPDPKRKRGGKVRVQGIYPWGHPDYQSSIGDYGKLHFGTEYGWQHEVRDAPRGREFGFAGHFILCVCMGREFLEIRRQFSIGGHTYERWGFKDMLAAGWALISEAEKRGDYITILTSPRLWEKDYDQFWQGDLLEKELPGQMAASWYNRDGTKAEFSARLGVGPHGGHLSADRKTLYINPSTERLDQGINDNYERHLANQMSPSWSDVGNLAPPLFEHSNDYEAIKKFWLGMPNFGTGDYRHLSGWATFPEWFWFYIQYMSGKFGANKKTDVVWLGTSQYPQMINVGWKILEDLQPKLNVWYFDLGDRNKEGWFFGAEAKSHDATRIINGRDTGIPLMVGKGGHRLFNYVFVDDISKLTERVLEVALKMGVK